MWTKIQMICFLICQTQTPHHSFFTSDVRFTHCSVCCLLLSWFSQAFSKERLCIFQPYTVMKWCEARRGSLEVGQRWSNGFCVWRLLMWLHEHIGSCDRHLWVNENFTTPLRRPLKGEKNWRKGKKWKNGSCWKGIGWKQIMMQLEWNEIDLDGMEMGLKWRIQRNQ